MSKLRLSSHRLIRVLIVLLMLSQASCVFDTSGVPVGCWRYDCTVGIYKCKTWHKALDVVVKDATSCYKAYRSATLTYPNEGFRVGLEAYCGKNWLIGSMTLDDLRGSLWIKPHFGYNVNTTPTGGVQFTLKHDAAAIYIAYDSRVLDEPNWLEPPEYTMQYRTVGPGGLTDDPAYVTIKMPDVLNKTNETKLKVYRYHKAPKAGQTFQIPGNQSGFPKWPAGLNPSDTAMYIVIIKPLQDYDCSKLIPENFVEDVVYDSCSIEPCPSLTTVKANAKTKAEDRLKLYAPGTHLLAEPNCVPAEYCGDRKIFLSNFGVNLEPRIFVRHSEIEFDASKYTSKADITIKGKKVSANVNGTLHFEYLLDKKGQMTEMLLNGMILRLGSIKTSAGDFNDTVVALMTPTKADLTDPNAPFGQPGNTYLVPVDTLITSASCDQDGEPLFVVALNRNAVDISIDHTTRTFTIKGGPLRATLTVNDEPTDLDISINLTGHFLNFLIVPGTDESQTFSECNREGKNADDIHLDASTSFEIYGDPIPTNPADYVWYEDYGLVTEKIWGTGKQVTIAKNQIGFGQHVMTLALRDDFGAVAFDTFIVEVGDLKAPNLFVPTDRLVYMAIQPPASAAQTQVKVSIGQAWSADDCAGSNILIGNDAPAGLVFPAGQTPVTWTADDGRGNVAKGLQNVQVFLVLLNDITSLVDAVGLLEASVVKTAGEVTACLYEPNCPIELDPLLAATDQLMGIIRDAPSELADDDGYAAIVSGMESARSSLAEASAALTQSNNGAEDWQTARMAAIDHLLTASGHLEKARTLTPPDSMTPPGCFIATAAYGTDMADDVRLLRAFRDERLLTNAPGRWVVDRYYRYSPPVAEVIARHGRLRWIVRALLMPVVSTIRHPVAAGIIVVGMLACVRRRRRIAAVLSRR
ncbi:MAG: hypothetical protein JXQ73_13515 [Phycisphaerae bacterium]|nr:hypothetical protein [Phycisphaerae bacterium]